MPCERVVQHSVGSAYRAALLGPAVSTYHAAITLRMSSFDPVAASSRLLLVQLLATIRTLESSAPLLCPRYLVSACLRLSLSFWLPKEVTISGKKKNGNWFKKEKCVYIFI